MTKPKQVTAAGAFIFDKNNRVFLAKFSKKFHQQWSIPGGKLDFGEDFLEAVVREVREETNIEITSPEFLECGSFVVDDTHVVYADYTAEFPEGSEVSINDEFSEWGFFSLKELDSIPIIPKTKSTTLFAMRQRSRKVWADTLAPYNLGLIRKTVSIQDWQSNWTEAFDWVAKHIRECVHADCVIDHVGSTSIPNLPSKPILDIQIVYKNLKQLQEDIPALEQLGFEYKGDSIGRVNKTELDADRHFFAFYNTENNVDYVHVHAFPEGHSHIDRHIVFRDRLRADPKLVQEYSALKSQLRKSGMLRHEYTTAKDAFVQKILS